MIFNYYLSLNKVLQKKGSIILYQNTFIDEVKTI